MEVTNGFIDHIFNYCDRWCETCAFTSWCALFADCAKAEASRDPHLKAVAEAPPLRHEVKEIPEWIVELLEKAQDEVDKMTDEEKEAMMASPVNEDDPLMQRGHNYAMTVHQWLQTTDRIHDDPNDPRSVIAWFHTVIPAKIARAMYGIGLADLDEPDEPTDYDGSAKVALIAIERSRTAWQEIASKDPSAPAAAAIADLSWLESEVERMFPRARQFVRPAFDEPDEVARLLASTNDTDN